MSIVESDGPPSWSLDASETGEYKMPVGRGGGVKSTPCPPSSLPTGALYSPQFRSHQETNMAARRTVNDTYDLTEKSGTVRMKSHSHTKR